MTNARSLLRVAVGVAISAASIYLVTRALDVNETVTAIQNARWELIGAVFALLSLDVGLRSLRWRALLSPIARLSAASVLGHLLVGYLANNALPARLGELVRAFSLADREGVSRSATVGSVVVERLLDVTLLATAALLGVAMLSPGSALLFAAMSGLVIGGLGLVTLVLLGRNARLLDRVPAGRLRAAFHGFLNGVSVVRSRRVLAQSTGLTALAWALTAAAFLVAGSAIGLEVTVAQALLLAASVNLATAIPAGPGYLGTFEFAAISVGAAIGIPPTSALAIAVIVHAATLATTTVGGLGALLVLHVAPETVMPRPWRTKPALAVVNEDDPASVRADRGT